MEPLFENRVLLDREVLQEWYGHELDKTHRVNVWVHLGFAAVYLLAAATFAVCAVQMNMPVLWLFFGVFLLCAAILFAVWRLRCRFQVWLAMHKDKGQIMGKEYATRFYPHSILAMKNADDLPDLPRLQRQLDEAQQMQRQVERLIQQAGTEDGGDTALQLQTQLQALQRQMDGIERNAKSLTGGGWYGYETLQDVQATENLFILTVDGQAVLVDKDGFCTGTLDAFEAFIADKLQAAGGAEQSPVQRRGSLRRARHIREALEKEKSASGAGNGGEL